MGLARDMSEVKVKLLPVTEEQMETLKEAAHTLRWLGLLTGRAEHEAQSAICAKLSNPDYAYKADWYAAVPVPKEAMSF